MILRVGHLYPEYLNIYADRGNIAVLARRAAARGHDLQVESITLETPLEPGAHDLLYVGGGQDREQAMIAPDLAARSDALRSAVDDGAALLAVCGGYQLLGRGYRGRDGSWMAGAGLFPHETIAGENRMIGDVLLESTLPELPGRTIAGFENHAGRTVLDPGAEPLGRVVAGYGNDGTSGFEGARVGRAIGTYLHWSAAAAQPVARRPAPLVGRGARDGRRPRAARATPGRAGAPGARGLGCTCAGPRRPPPSAA